VTTAKCRRQRRSKMSAMPTVLVVSDGGDKYRKGEVQLCHKWACSNQIETGNWGVFRADHEVVVCCIACHRKIDQNLGRLVVWD
jgi:hypothetical protein